MKFDIRLFTNQDKSYNVDIIDDKCSFSSEGKEIDYKDLRPILEQRVRLLVDNLEFTENDLDDLEGVLDDLIPYVKEFDIDSAVRDIKQSLFYDYVNTHKSSFLDNLDVKDELDNPVWFILYDIIQGLF